MEVALRVNHVSKSFGKKKIIDDVSFELNRGEVFGFLGPNGAGKTTMIKMITGFLSVDNGKIEINGFDHHSQYEKAMASIGAIVENPELYRDLSAVENLKMYARLHDNVDHNRIQEALEMVGMQDRAREKTKKYSLGMKQRVGLAMALLHRPQVLILDEPTNGLDPAGIRELRDILKKLAHEEQVAVMVSSHQLSEMQLMCDRVGVISTGRLLSVNTMKELTLIKEHESSQRLLTPDVEKAILSLSDEWKDKVTAQAEDYIDLQINKAQINDILRVLLDQDIRVFGIQTIESTLEDAFLNITGGGLKIE
ncbi:MAG TPA: ABC transporter ATP-binding protein [Clostridiaceae bacterium]|nr:ABC transporter ATP-binding protein [Clostridiaceae bacterium]